MSELAQVGVLRRVLVALDSSASSALLPAAAELAAQLRAELSALFVEDADLLRLAALPFAQEVCAASAESRPLTRDSVERRLRTLAEQLRRSVEETARRADVQWSFVVTRSTIRQVAEDATRDTDVLLLPQRPPMSTSGATSASTRLASVLHRPGCVAVLFDGSAAAERALQVAIAVGERQGREVLVLLAPDGQSRALLETRIRGVMAERPVVLRCARDDVRTEADLRRRVDAESCSLLLLPLGAPAIAGVSLARLATEFSPLVAITS